MSALVDRTSPQLITVTPNPAVDITYNLDRMGHGETNRVSAVYRRAGGKGINVARVAAKLGLDVEVRGFVGGANGEAFTQLLHASGLQQSWQRIDGETRSTVAIVDELGATLLNEPGPVVNADDWRQLTEGTVMRLRRGSLVVLSGSYPPGTTPADVTDFIVAVRSVGARIIVDTSGPFLTVAARAGADLLKPNREELYNATGLSAPIPGASALLSLGAGAVVASWGSVGLFLVAHLSGELRAWRATPPEVTSGNPTGAGDAAVAALAVGMLELADTTAPPTALVGHLTKAAALSASTVVEATAGHVDLDTYDRFLHQTKLEEIHDTR